MDNTTDLDSIKVREDALKCVKSLTDALTRDMKNCKNDMERLHIGRVYFLAASSFLCMLVEMHEGEVKDILKQSVVEELQKKV